MTSPESANKAVFLSYASQDADAAKRICDALRQAGVEVWFDQNELRGGEAWDRSIRRQIRECALFVPVISASTQARPEGYFRLEWHLAEQRSHLIAKGRPFIVPVGIDATTDREALVPDAFLAVQWTRLPGGETPPAFGEQMKRLLSGGPFDSAQGRQGAGSREPGASAEYGDPDLQKDGPPQIPDYDLIRLIGQGSYGDVWLARGVTGIYRAIKVVWRARFTDAGPYEREFRGLKEFAAISLGESIQMALLHVGRNDAAGFFYYVMELADDVDRGRDIDPARYVPLTLAEVRARQGRVRVPAKDCLTYGVELARVLAGLHRRGLIHRDIKPSNVILVGGVPKLADIGLVTPADATMTYVGTEGFVPPEGPGSASADVFALGRLLYELATGLDRQEFPQLPPDLNKLPDCRLLLELNEIILRACDPVAAQRYPDGAALLADLGALQAGNSVRRRRVGSGLLRVATVLGVVAAVVAVGWWQWPLPSPASGLPAHPEPVERAPAERPAADKSAQADKSLAVLPLENLSPDPANAFFTDGMHAEIISTLGLVPELKVISRNSTLAFKGSTAPLEEIGQKLGVANVLTGSVRREGSKVRIALELRRVSDGALLWSPVFERELGGGVLALQQEIAGEVARLLQARERKGSGAGAQYMTKDPKAYDLLVKARSEKKPDEQIKLLEEALRLDPGFMPAASLLSDAYRSLYFNPATDFTLRKNYAAEMKRWAETASRLAPGGAGDGELCFYYLLIERDYRRALALAQNEVRALPNDAQAHSRVAYALFNLDRVGEAAEAWRRAIALDPLDPNLRLLLATSLGTLRRPVEFEAAAEQYELVAGDKRDRGQIMGYRYLVSGVWPDTPVGLEPEARLYWLEYKRHNGELLAALEKLLAAPELQDLQRFRYLCRQSTALRRLGRNEEALAVGRTTVILAEKLNAEPEIDSSNKDQRMMKALTCAGRADEAIAVGRRWREGASPDNEIGERRNRDEQLAEVYAVFGRKRECVALLTGLIHVADEITVPRLRTAPEWDNVRDDPGFQALINDPKNSEPF